MKRLITICAALAVAILSNSALADPTAADPVETGSWTQAWQNTWSADRAEYMIVGSTFEPVALSNFSTVGWALCASNGQYAIATGPYATAYYNMNFTTNTPTPFAVYEVFWNGDTKVGADISYWGPVWTADYNWNGWDQKLDCSVVPVPGAILLGLLGLSAAGIKLRKFA